MKTIVQLIALLILAQNISAQRQISESYTLTSHQKIVLDLGIADNIVIKTWDKNELKIEANISINNGKDNNMYEYEVFQSDHRISFEANLKNFHRLGISVDGINHNCFRTDINYQIWLPADNKLVLETISGNIEIRGHNADSELKTISGFIDTDVNDATGCKLEAKTMTGTIYSDLSIQAANSENEMAMHLLGGAKIEQNIGQADKALTLNTISGDIYIRKR